MLGRVMIGCPVRNRAWVLPRYLECLQLLDYPKELITYCFIINNCIDNTREILVQLAQNQDIRVRLVMVSMPDATGHKRGYYDFFHLAYLRNLLLQEFLNSECDYLFSVDSDIMVPPNVISHLISNGCDIVSALVCNGHQIKDDKVFNILNRGKEGGLIHIRDFPRDRIFRVDCTGAAYLISRRVIADYKVRYSNLFGSEDIGFCKQAADRGIEIYCDGRIECLHIMDEPEVT